MDSLEKALILLTEKNQTGALICDRFFHILWENDFTSRFCKNGDLTDRFSAPWDSLLQEINATGYAETVAKNQDGDRVKLCFYQTEQGIVLLLSSQFCGDSLAVSQLIHDLKNPLSLTKQCLETLSFCEGKQKEELLEMAENATRKALILTNNILSIVQKNDPEACYHKTTVSAKSLIASLCRETAVLLQSTELVFTADDQSGDACLFADGDAIGRILLNLFSNAVKYAKRCIHFSVCATHASVLFRLDNDGAPIPDEKKNTLFLPYKTTGGTGLGLCSARYLAESHGGSLSLAESALGGACFRLELPLAESKALVECAFPKPYDVRDTLLLALYERREKR